INSGISYDRIAAVSREEIRKVVVRDPPTIAGKAVKPDRIEKDGSSLVVYRPPQIQAHAPAQNAVALPRAQQELRKVVGAVAQPNVHTANLGHTVPNSSLPFASSKPVSVTSISARDEQALVKTRTELPTAASMAGKSQAIRPALNNSKTISESSNRPQPGVPGESPRTLAGPQIVKPINERGTRSHGIQSTLAAPIDSRPQPAGTVPAQPHYSSQPQATQQPVSQPQQQPYIVGRPSRQEIQRQAPAVRNYAQPQFVPQQAYRPTTPPYSPPVVNQPAQRYYSPPPSAQPAYRPAPVYTAPAPRPAPVQAPRPQPQASPARQAGDKK
ncbi:MAG: hypothetical protein ABI651_08750, partial [Verrucomicrobiota bacterium]